MGRSVLIINEVITLVFRKENQDQIKKNRNKLSKEEEYLEDLIEMEREITEQVSSSAPHENMTKVLKNYINV